MDKLIGMAAEIVLVKGDCGPMVWFVIDQQTEVHWCQRHAMFHIIMDDSLGSVYTEEEVLDVLESGDFFLTF